jgi:hypothetical protein
MDQRQDQSQQRGNAASNLPHNQPGERAPDAEVLSLMFRLIVQSTHTGTTVINHKATKPTQPAHMLVALLSALRVLMVSRINRQVRALVEAVARDLPLTARTVNTSHDHQSQGYTNNTQAVDHYARSPVGEGGSGSVTSEHRDS